MRTVHDIYTKLDQLAPFRYAESYDNVGILVGDASAYVTKALVCLDITVDVVNEAKRMGANLLISHHPIIFDPVKSVTRQSVPLVFEMIKNGINAICAHTNLDVAEGGVNDVLFDLLELTEKKPLGSAGPDGKLSLGRIGQLNEFMRPEDFAAYAKECLGAQGIRFTLGNRRIKTVAVAGGSGGFLMDLVRELDVDAFVTGDIKHDVFIRAQNENFTLIDGGHFATEICIVDVLTQRLSQCFDDLAFKVADTAEEKVYYG